MFSGVELTAGYSFASMVISTVGFSFLLYGKKQLRAPQLLVGVAWMALPVFLGDTLALCGSSAAVALGLWVCLRAGA